MVGRGTVALVAVIDSDVGYIECLFIIIEKERDRQSVREIPYLVEGFRAKEARLQIQFRMRIIPLALQHKTLS